MSERVVPHQSRPGAMFYIRNTASGQLLVRPAEDGGFVRFQHLADAQRYADRLNSGKDWPERFDWGGA